MTTSEQRIVVWCGNGANHKALAVKIANKLNLSGIVIDEKNNSKKKRNLFELFSQVIDRIRFNVIYNAWQQLFEYYDKKYPSWPAVPTIRVSNINSPETGKFTNNLAPDLIIVSGTSLVKDRQLQVPSRIGIINLHTGLSPYVKGGPNCTNWCIANNDWHLTGNTIMWLEAGIDSGSIIVSEHVDVKNCATLLAAQLKVMERAHELYLKAVCYLLTKKPPYQSVSQNSLGKGKLFLTKMWDSSKKRDLLKNWAQRKKSHVKQVPEVVKLPRL